MFHPLLLSALENQRSFHQKDPPRLQLAACGFYPIAFVAVCLSCTVGAYHREYLFLRPLLQSQYCRLLPSMLVHSLSLSGLVLHSKYQSQLPVTLALMLTQATYAQPNLPQAILIAGFHEVSYGHTHSYSSPAHHSCICTWRKVFYPSSILCRHRKYPSSLRQGLGLTNEFQPHHCIELSSPFCCLMIQFCYQVRVAGIASTNGSSHQSGTSLRSQ
mmetsp:Transcript_3841/g.5714  ORF Transcript_3841/g.5714 Transcript_3841/m.5714 type:complete len:216 (+) Transcript_3841:385-1032(+)